MDRKEGMIVALISRAIKEHFGKNPVKDVSEDVKTINDKLDQIMDYIKKLAERPAGETVIQLENDK